MILTSIYILVLGTVSIRSLLINHLTGFLAVQLMVVRIHGAIWCMMCCSQCGTFHLRTLLFRYAESLPKSERPAPRFRRLFSQTFCQTTCKAIAVQRQSSSFCLTFPIDPDIVKIVRSFMTEALSKLSRAYTHPLEP